MPAMVWVNVALAARGMEAIRKLGMPRAWAL